MFAKRIRKSPGYVVAESLLAHKTKSRVREHPATFEIRYNALRYAGTSMPAIAIKGVCHFFSETGTEGGYWAFQDEKFMNIPEPDKLACAKCGSWWDKKKQPDEPVVMPPERRRENKFCEPGEHTWKLAFPNGSWSYDGLHTLRDGDKLIILDRKDGRTIIWDGTINLAEHPVFSQTAHGLWIHADQVGADRNVWARYFLREYPAILIKNVP